MKNMHGYTGKSMSGTKMVPEKQAVRQHYCLATKGMPKTAKQAGAMGKPSTKP